VKNWDNDKPQPIDDNGDKLTMMTPLICESGSQIPSKNMPMSTSLAHLVCVYSLLLP
jgi:hypothetical protein